MSRINSLDSCKRCMLCRVQPKTVQGVKTLPFCDAPKPPVDTAVESRLGGKVRIP